MTDYYSDKNGNSMLDVTQRPATLMQGTRANDTAETAITRSEPLPPQGYKLVETGPRSAELVFNDAPQETVAYRCATYRFNEQEFTFVVQSPLDRALLTIFTKARETFLKKNRDYGNSFAKKGAKGVLVRWSDKFERLDTLFWNNQNPSVEDESVIDTAYDALVYNMLFIFCLIQGWVINNKKEETN